VSKPLLETSNFFGQPRAPREESELSENLFEQFGKGMIVNTPFARESVWHTKQNSQQLLRFLLVTKRLLIRGAKFDKPIIRSESGLSPKRTALHRDRYPFDNFHFSDGLITGLKITWRGSDSERNLKRLLRQLNQDRQFRETSWCSFYLPVE